MYDKFKKRFQLNPSENPSASSSSSSSQSGSSSGRDRAAKARREAQTPAGRMRQQIAREAARRLFAMESAEDPPDPGAGAGPSSAKVQWYYAAKVKAAAVLGHRVRPGDLPSDAAIDEQIALLQREAQLRNQLSAFEVNPDPDADAEAGPQDDPDADVPEGDGPPPLMSEHVDRFTFYKIRLLPLEQVKQDPASHPEGDALYHSLQVFEQACALRPYDEEFLLAALLHDVGKAVDPRNLSAATLNALEGALTPRVAWLLEHIHDRKPLDERARRAMADPLWLDDLDQLRVCNRAGRIPGAHVRTVDEALAHLRDLENEAYLDPDPDDQHL